jgi:hypothetical protein
VASGLSRPAPLHLALGPLAAELGDVRAALASAGTDPHRRDQFGRSPAVQRLLERLQAPDLVARRPEAAEAYLALLYAAYRFWDSGARIVAPPRATVEPALSAAPPRQPPAIPGGACYLRLPVHWFWARVGDQAPHEPLDGCFLAAGSGAEEITVVAVLGLRPDRMGFTQIALHVPPGDFLAAATDRRDPPFAPLMDGGEAAGFRSVATAGELLALVSLALAVAGR